MWVGIATQCVGVAFLAGAYHFPASPHVPRWTASPVVPGNGASGLITGLPMAAGAIGLAVYAWRWT